MKNIAVIGGTGMKELFSPTVFEQVISLGYQMVSVEKKDSDTPFGAVPIQELCLQDAKGERFLITFLHRHHHPNGGTTPPHSLNNKANVMGVTLHNPHTVVTIHSVGSMHKGFGPGTLGCTKDFIDCTGVVSTFYDDDAVHVDLMDHFRAELRNLVKPILQSQRTSNLEMEHIHAQMTGPQFESVAQIKALQILGATTVGMTLVPEAKLIAERGYPQLALLASSNWASGCSPQGEDAEIEHEKVEEQAQSMHHLIWQVLLSVLQHS